MHQELHVVLHGLAIKKYATADQVSDLVKMPIQKVAAILGALGQRELLVGDEGGYSLTPIGGVALNAEYSRFYADVRSSVDFERAYNEFEKMNRDLKLLITQWQVIEKGGVATLNDHSDADYDNRIIDRLVRLHERFEPVLEQFGRMVPRLTVYHEKLGEALDRVEDGDVAWVSDVRIDSYHTVWFELHEDLLRILGKQREE